MYSFLENLESEEVNFVGLCITMRISCISASNNLHPTSNELDAPYFRM